jgi:pimeloyl-ACP methyl ester carboxylesterase
MPPAKPTASRSSPSSRRPAPQRPPETPHRPPETIDPVWLLRAIALTVIAALICAWLTACWLVYQGEWQLVLHPSATINQTPASVNLAYDEIHFGASETGQPRLTGWWVAAQNSPPATAQPTLQPIPIPKYAAYTILYLHDGAGSLSDTVPTLALLHRTGLNVFAFDYSGFGNSDASAHPSEARMAQDAAAALDYLTSTRHIPTRTIVPYGVGLGAALAANLAHDHPDLPVVILDNPDPDPDSTAAAAHPSHLIPVRLLFGNSFDIAMPLATLATPKLLIAGGPNSSNPIRDLSQLQSLFRHAASPSFAVTLPPNGYEAAYQAALQRFLDQHLPTH